MHYYIYGAQAIALGTYKAFQQLNGPEKTNLKGFLVTSLSGNPSILAGLPVQETHKFVTKLSQAQKDDITVFIATPETVMEQIEDCLEAAGLHNHRRITSLKWAEITEAAFAATGDFKPLSQFEVGAIGGNLKIFKMTHAFDRVLKTDFKDPAYMNTVQVGTTLTDKKQADFYDDAGDNISGRNKNYSELTGLYWVWKNKLDTETDAKTYYGLAHYRRMLNLTDEDLHRLGTGDVDVVLPYPMPYEPNIEEHHKRYLSDKEWTSVLQALRELSPEYASAFADVLKGEYMYNYNIILAKRDVLSDYCSWLFPILFRVEELNAPECHEHPNRFIGYIAETLETLYFMYNKQGYEIAHAGCRFLILNFQ